MTIPRSVRYGVGRVLAKRTTGLDRDAMKELELYVDNDSDLYHRQTVPIEKNLYLKIVKGTYSKALAPKMWAHLLESGAKKYAKEFSVGTDWHVIFPKAERDALAEEYARAFERAVANDEYRHLDKTLPKKYRRTH